MNKKFIIAALLAIVAMAGKAQIHYRIEGHIGKPDFTGMMELFDVVKLQRVDTIEVVNGIITPKEGVLPEMALCVLEDTTKVLVQTDSVPYTQSKLVRCVKGSVLDVAVDIRKGSPTYGQHVAVELTEDNHCQFFVPRGFAHGFAVLSETAVFQYKCDEFYAPQSEGAIAWDDPDLAIDWQLPVDKIILSEKDRHHPYLRDIVSPFNYINSDCKI